MATKNAEKMDTNEALREQVRTLQETVASLLQQNQSAMKDLAGVMGQMGSKLADNKEQRVARQRRDMFVKLSEFERELATGEHVYRVTYEGEPCMGRIVGGKDVHEAKAKYKKYFGIRQFAMSTTSEDGEALTFAELPGVPSLDDASAWPDRQRKNILAGPEAIKEYDDQATRYRWGA